MQVGTQAAQQQWPRDTRQPAAPAPDHSLQVPRRQQVHDCAQVLVLLNEPVVVAHQVGVVQRGLAGGSGAPRVSVTGNMHEGNMRRPLCIADAVVGSKLGLRRLPKHPAWQHTPCCQSKP